MNFKSWISLAVEELTHSENPQFSAEVLLRHVTGKSREWVLAFGNEAELTDSQTKELMILLKRRKKGEPIAYLTGMREFWSLSLYVSSATLIPRPDTESLVEQVLIKLPLNTSCRILDLGTGTGAIALALASERPDCQIVAVDIIPGAVQLAKCNVERLKIRNVQVMQSNWFSALDGQLFDIVVSNPPYLSKESPYLLQGDLRFEPHTALVADDNGMSHIRHIITYSHRYLHNNGWLFIEHGWNQGAKSRTLFAKTGFQHVETYYDYSNNERLTVGKWYKFV